MDEGLEIGIVYLDNRLGIRTVRETIRETKISRVKEVDNFIRVEITI